MPEQGLARSECSMRGPSKTWFLPRAYSSFLVLWLQLLSTTQQLHFLPSPCPCSGSLPHTHRCFQILRSELSFAFSLKARSPQALSAFPSKCLVSPLHTHTHAQLPLPLVPSHLGLSCEFLSQTEVWSSLSAPAASLAFCAGHSLAPSRHLDLAHFPLPGAP